MRNKIKMTILIVVVLLIIGAVGAVLIGNLNKSKEVILFTGYYGGYTTKAEANSIKGQYIDIEGNVYEYRIPCNEEHEMSIAINELNGKVVEKYKGRIVSKMSKEDLNLILENRNYVTEEYEDKQTCSEDAPSSFIYVMSNGKAKLLSKCSSANVKENISTSAKNILDVLVKNKIKN